MPLVAVVFYFVITPHYYPEKTELAVLVAVLILTYFIPIISIFLLANLGVVSSIHLAEVSDRRRPLLLLIAVHSILLFKVLNPTDFYELHYFFLAIIMALLLSYFLVLLGKKISLHLLAMGGVLGFFMAISVVQQQNYLFLIILFVLASGFSATSRLLLNAHSKKELIMGFLIGFFTQILVFYWASLR